MTDVNFLAQFENFILQQFIIKYISTKHRKIKNNFKQYQFLRLISISKVRQLRIFIENVYIQEKSDGTESIKMRYIKTDVTKNNSCKK